MNSRSIDDVLLYVYIAQNANKRGVLEEDCKDFLEDIYRLIRQRQIKKNKWYSKEMFVVTYDGEQKSKELFEPILEKNKSCLLKELNNFSIGFLHNINMIGLRNEYICYVSRIPNCLLGEHILRPRLKRLGFELASSYRFPITEGVEAFPSCLLNIKKVAKLINSFYSLIESKKLAVRAHYYHIGDYGKWQDDTPFCFVISKEVEEFVNDFISSRVSAIDSSCLLTPSDFSANAEFYWKHRMYHFFEHIENENAIDKRDTELLNKKLIIKNKNYSSREFDFTRREVEEVLQLFESKGAIVISDKLSFRVKSLEHYNELIHDTFVKPLVDRFLCQGKYEIKGNNP